MLLSTGPVESKAGFLASARVLQQRGLTIYCTEGTTRFLTTHGVTCQEVAWPMEDRHPNALELLKERQVDLVVNIPKNLADDELDNDYLIRRHAVDYGIPLITNLQVANLLVSAMQEFPVEDLECWSWETYMRS